MPVLKHAAGDKPDVELSVRRFRRRLVRHRDDLGLAVGIAVKVKPLTSLT